MNRDHRSAPSRSSFWTLSPGWRLPEPRTATPATATATCTAPCCMTTSGTRQQVLCKCTGLRGIGGGTDLICNDVMICLSLIQSFIHWNSHITNQYSRHQPHLDKLFRCSLADLRQKYSPSWQKWDSDDKPEWSRGRHLAPLSLQTSQHRYSKQAIQFFSLFIRSSKIFSI